MKDFSHSVLDKQLIFLFFLMKYINQSFGWWISLWKIPKSFVSEAVWEAGVTTSRSVQNQSQFGHFGKRKIRMCLDGINSLWFVKGHTIPYEVTSVLCIEMDGLTPPQQKASGGRVSNFK